MPETWHGLPHFLTSDSILPQLHRIEQTEVISIADTWSRDCMSVSYNYVNLSAIGCLATVMQTREKCLCQLINYECIWSQASYPKINFLFAIKKRCFKDRALELVLQKYYCLIPTGHHEMLPCTD